MTLFEITTENVRLVWSGPVRTPAIGMASGERPFGLRIVRLDEGARPRLRRAKHAHRLFEETPYTLFVQSLDGSTPSLHHEDPVLVGRVRRASPDALHGPLNFGSQVGRSTFVVALGGVPHLRLSVEVVPSKLDYRHDYRALVADVARLADDLALQHVAAAYQEGTAGPERGGARSEVALLAALAGDLEKALRQAFRHPVRHLERTEEAEALHRIRRPDAALVRRLARQMAQNDTVVAPTRRWTLDTPEHRWLAAHLAALDARLVRRLEAPARTPRQEAARAAVRRLHERVRRWRAHPALQASSSGAVAPTLRLMRTPGYREAAAALELLGRRFSLEAGSLPFRLRDLHRLYEYACLLWLVDALAEATGHRPDPSALVEPDATGLDLRLRGGSQRLVFPLPGGGVAALRYTPRFAGPDALVPQKPDFVLTVRRPGEPMRRYVLDAKYRLNAAPRAVARYGVPAPPASALGVLHRYRDAIVEEKATGPERRVAEAVVLYPWRDDGRYARSRFVRSLARLGVGAIPVLPGATEHLRAWVRRVLGTPAR